MAKGKEKEGKIDEKYFAWNTNTKIHVHAEPLSKEEKKLIFDEIATNKDIESVYLSSTKFDNEDCQNLAKAIKDNGNITEIGLGWGCYNNEGLTHIADAIIEVNKIVKLDLKCTDLQSGMLNSLGKLLEKDLVSYIRTGFKSCGESYSTIFPALEKNESLEYLDFDNIGQYTRQDEPEELLEIFINHPNLKALDFGVSRTIVKDNFDKFCELLKKDQLEFVKINHCDLKDKHAKELSEILSNLKNLREFNAHYNNWTLKGIVNLAKARGKNSNLKLFDIHTNYWDNDAIKPYIQTYSNSLELSAQLIYIDHKCRWNNGKYKISDIKYLKEKIDTIDDGGDITITIKSGSPAAVAEILNLDKAHEIFIANATPYNDNHCYVLAESLSQTKNLKDIVFTRPSWGIKGVIKLIQAKIAQGNYQIFEVDSINVDQDTCLYIEKCLRAGHKANEITISIINNTPLEGIELPANKEDLSRKLLTICTDNPAEDTKSQEIAKLALKLMSFEQSKEEKGKLLLQAFENNPNIPAELGEEKCGDMLEKYGYYQEAAMYYVLGSCVDKAITCLNLLKGQQEKMSASKQEAQSISEILIGDEEDAAGPSGYGNEEQELSGDEDSSS